MVGGGGGEPFYLQILDLQSQQKIVSFQYIKGKAEHLYSALHGIYKPL